MKNLNRKVWLSESAGCATSTAPRRPPGQLVDAMLELYVSWREECARVGVSYENWSRADAADRTLAFGAYVAALDREGHAAASYERMVRQISLI
jgi:hypothetical protein